jgi:serine protease AprX
MYNMIKRINIILIILVFISFIFITKDILSSEEEERYIITLNLEKYESNNVLIQSLKNNNLTIEERREKIKIFQDNFIESYKNRKKGILEILSIKKVEMEIENNFMFYPGFSVKLNNKAIEELMKNDFVKSIEPHREYSILLDKSINNVQAPLAWNLDFKGTNLKGDGQTICVIDTGIQKNHESFLSNAVIGEKCFCNANGNPCCPNPNGTYTYESDYATDDNGHGTHVSGIIISNHHKYKGVAPNAKIVSVKILGAGGDKGNDADIAKGIEWCINNKDVYGITVISMSIGTVWGQGSCDNHILGELSNYAVSQGIFVVAASGNNKYDDMTYSPACASNITSVGAIYKKDYNINFEVGGICTDVNPKKDDIACFTNLASFLDILAPGVEIYSTTIGNKYLSQSGTSMATPHVSGAAALLIQYYKLQNNTNPNPLIIKDALKKSSKNISHRNNNYLFNYPILQIYDSLNYVDITPPLINYVLPTPIDNEKTFNNNVFIKVNANDNYAIDSCILLWNSSEKKIIMNKTGDLKSVLCTATFKVDKPGIYTYRVFINDTNNNINYTEIRTLQILNNTPPIINSFSPKEKIITIINNQEKLFEVDFKDAESDNLEVIWLINGVPVQNKMTTQNTDSFLLSNRGVNTYNLTVIIDDGFFKTSNEWIVIINPEFKSPPNIINYSPSSLNYSISKNQDLKLSINYDDPEFNFIIVSWKVNDELIKQEQTNNPSRTYSEFIFRHNGSYVNSYKIEVIVNDTNLNDNKIWIINITEKNTPPKLIKDIPRQRIPLLKNLTLNLSEYFEDNDNDIITYSTTLVSNIYSYIFDNKLIIIPDNLMLLNRTITISATDGTDTIYTTFIFEVTNDYDLDGHLHYVLGGTDCDDTNHLSPYINQSCIRLGHINATYQLNENNVCVCLGGISYDYDLDGYYRAPFHGNEEYYGIITKSKGLDCDDYNANIYPGAPEICGNNIDENCDGKDAECPMGYVPSPSPSPSTEIPIRPINPINNNSLLNNNLTVKEEEKKYSFVVSDVIENAKVSLNNIPVTEYSFILNKNVKDFSIKIVSSKDYEEIKKVIPKYYDSFDVIMEGINEEDFKSVIIYYRVNKTQINQYNKYAVLYRKETYIWRELPVDVIGSDNDYWYFKAVSSTFSTFVIGLSNEKISITSSNISNNNQVKEEVVNDNYDLEKQLNYLKEIPIQSPDDLSKKSNLKNIIFFILLIIGFIGTVAVINFKENKNILIEDELFIKEEDENSIDKGIIDYINKRIEMGHFKGEIIEDLVKIGWEKEVIEDYFIKKENNEEEIEKNKSDDAIKEYILTRINLNHQSDEILNDLIKIGWEKETIENYILQIRNINNQELKNREIENISKIFNNSKSEEELSKNNKSFNKEFELKKKYMDKINSNFR